MENIYIIQLLCRFYASSSGEDWHLESTRKLSLTPMIHVWSASYSDAPEDHNRESVSPQSRNRSGLRSRLTRCKTSSSTMAMSRGTDLWDNLSLNNAEYVDRQRHSIRERNVQNPIYNRLNEIVESLADGLQWTVTHIELAFTWPTQYNEEGGQGDIVFEEDKVKVAVDVQNYKIEDLGRQHVEDIVQGWIKHLRSTVTELHERQAVDFTPMAEYELWRVRETRYNTLLEQVKHPFVRETIGNNRPLSRR